jgi:UDP-3-O-[3-hydroxymyristoyl] glucosamine N-acyltransferase
MSESMKKPHKEPSPSFIVTVGELARFLDCPFEGNGETEIRGVSSLEKAQEGDLVFLAHPKYRSLLEKTKGSAAIIPQEEKYERIPVLKSENPHLSFVKAVALFYKPYRLQPGVHPSALVSPSAKIGKNVAIGAFAYVGDEVEIGEKTIIFPFTVIYPRVKIGKETIIHSHVSIREEIHIGNRVIIHNGAVIGSDGFGFIQDKDRSHIKIPQTGTVIIEDDVEVGANATIDRATLGETIIRRGTKIDNLVQVAHNVEIGPNSILAAQVGIAGSSSTGKNVILGGQAGVADHVRIEDNVIAAAQSGVTKDIRAGSIVAGSPHLDINTWRKSRALLPQLYDLVKDIKKLKKRVEKLEKKK